MTDAHLLDFLPVAAVLVAMPGPDSLLVIKNTLESKKRAGIATVAGVQAGIALHAAAAAAGLSALLYYSPLAFHAIETAGALYLAYLGCATMTGGVIRPTATHPTTATLPLRQAFAQGLLCNLLNPKVVILFVALMPGFVDFSRGHAPSQFIALALALLAINTPFQTTLVFAAAQFNRQLTIPRRARLVQLTLGGLLLLFAATLFAEQITHWNPSTP